MRTRSRRSPFRVFACLTVAMATLLGSGGFLVSSASADDRDAELSSVEERLNGPDVIRYDTGEYPPVRFLRSYVEIQEGTRLPSGGCQFVTELTMKPGEQAIGTVERAYEPSSCRR